MPVTHTRGCEKRFRMALPSTYKLVTGERGIKKVQAECPHCGDVFSVRLPEGKVAVRADEQDDGAGDGDGMRSPSNANRNVHGDDTLPDDDGLRDEEGEDEEESEGDRGLLPDDELPQSGPYRPGSGERDSLKNYYADRPTKLVRLAKKESNPRLRAAGQVFLDMLRESRSQSGGWPV